MRTLVLSGLEELADAAAPRLPALELLLARARARPATASCCWAALAQQAGGDLARWPVGPVSALGELGRCAGECLRLEPLGMDAEQQGAFRLRAAALDIEPDEAAALAAAFNDTFAADGLRLAAPVPGRWYLLREAGDSTPWQGFSSPTLAAGERPAPPEPALRRLLSEVEMLFFAHPVNEARRAQGRCLVTGLHPWGGGRLEDPPAASPAAVAGEPYLAGLQRLGVAADVAWPLPPDALSAPALERVEAEVVAPLVRELRRGRLARLRILTGQRQFEVRPADLLRVWRRPQHWAEAC